MDTTEPAAPPKRHTFGYWLRENVRQIVGAMVMVLIVRAYVVEIFKIPTGSMATTLYGMHVRIACPRCGWEYAVGASPPPEHYDAERSRDFRARRADQAAECPSCGQENRLGDFHEHGGHKIIANKWVYLVKDPKRWDVVVFRFLDGERRPLNYIKRLAGLPGERISISRGDVWIDGKIAAKPLDVQEAVWIPVYDSRCENPHKEAWRLEPGWTRDGTDAPAGWNLAAPAGTPARISFVRPVRSDLAYNNTGYVSGETVGDLRVRAEVACEPGGVLEIGIREDADEFIAHLEESGPGFLLRRTDGIETGRWPVPERLAAGKAREVSFVNADDRLRLSVEGSEILAVDVQAEPDARERESGVWLAGEGRLSLARVRIDRDIHYLTGGLDGFGIPAGEYFFLGDNSANSNDSRGWNSPELDQVHTVRRERILGRASYALLYVEIDWPWRIPWKRLSVKEVW